MNLQEMAELHRVQAKLSAADVRNRQLQNIVVSLERRNERLVNEAKIHQRRGMKMINQEIATRLSDTLNDLLALDPIGVTRLTQLRVEAGARVADHSAVQVRCDDHRARPELGLLGVLNAVAGKDAAGAPAIVALVDNEGVIVCFKPAADLTAKEKLGVGQTHKMIFA